jgi:PKD repeat protein
MRSLFHSTSLAAGSLRAALPCMLAVGCGGGSATNQPPVPILGDDLTVIPREAVAISGRRSTDADGMIVKYAWDLGDGTTGEGPEVTHAWTQEAVYAVTLTVTDDRGAWATAAIRVTVTNGDNMGPNAIVDGPGRGLPNEALTFSGERSTDPDGAITEHHWDLGDGTTANTPVVTHAFAAEGEYAVTLIVVDDDGAASQASRTVIISTIPGNEPPIAEAGPDQTGDVGAVLLVDGRGSTDPDGAIVSYAWDFGDGGTASTPQASHTYGAPGSYTVTLTVEDDGGSTASDTKTITIAPPPSYDGTWVLNPNVAAVTCDNTHRTYQVPFPAAELAIMGTVQASATAVVVGQGRTMTGSVDRGQAPPELILAWDGSESDAICGSATVQHRFSASMTGPTTLADGRFSVIYQWTDPFCTCSRTFDVTGAKRP